MYWRPKVASWKATPLLGVFWTRKKKIEIVSEQRAMFLISNVWGIMGGWGGGGVVHGGEAVFGMPAFAIFPWAAEPDTPICVKTLFLTALVTLKQQRLMNTWSYLVGVASTPSGQHLWLKKVKTAVFRWISFSQSVISAFLVHFFTLLDVLTIAIRPRKSWFVNDPPLSTLYK